MNESNSQPIDLIYIASPGHSGSTLLDLLLSAHSEIFSVGEIKQLAPTWNRPCTCNAPTIWECKFWQQVDTVMKRGGSRGLVDINVMSDDPKQFAEDNWSVLSATREVSGASILLDSSKNISRLKKLDAVPNINLHRIRLQRNPGGVVYSNVKKGRSWLDAARQTKNNAMSAEKYFSNKPHTIIKYEDLARNPEQEISRLLNVVGLNIEENQIQNHRNHERHNIGGNRMRFSGSAEIKLDEKWKRKLGMHQKLGVRLMQTDTVYRVHQKLRKKQNKTISS